MRGLPPRRRHRDGGFDARLGSFADGYVARKIALTHGFCYAPSVVATWCVYADSVSRSTALQVGKAREVLDTLPKRIAADPVFPAWYAGVFASRWRFAANFMDTSLTPPSLGTSTLICFD